MILTESAPDTAVLDKEVEVLLVVVLDEVRMVDCVVVVEVPPVRTTTAAPITTTTTIIAITATTILLFMAYSFGLGVLFQDLCLIASNSESYRKFFHSSYALYFDFLMSSIHGRPFRLR